jgi:hypothetical protein
MLDLAIGVEEMNYGLKRRIELRTLLEFLRNIWPIVVVAGALCFHLWVRGQNIQAGYNTQQLKKEAKQLQQWDQRLELEERILGNIETLNSIARGDLGVIILRTNPIPPALTTGRETGNSERLELGSLAHVSRSPERSTLN